MFSGDKRQQFLIFLCSLNYKTWDNNSIKKKEQLCKKIKEICIWLTMFLQQCFLAINLRPLYLHIFPFKWSHICRENTFVGCNHDKFLCQCQTAYSVIESCFELLVPQVQLIGCLTGSLWTLLQGLVGVCSNDALFTRMPRLIDLERS